MRPLPPAMEPPPGAVWVTRKESVRPAAALMSAARDGVGGDIEGEQLVAADEMGGGGRERNGDGLHEHVWWSAAGSAQAGQAYWRAVGRRA